MRLIIPASEIPIGSTVTKRTGSKEYTIMDRIIIHESCPRPRIITAEDGCRFLIDPISPGNVSTVTAETELAWVTDKFRLQDFLEEEGEDK